jgi:circadian clock protein KaiB
MSEALWHEERAYGDVPAAPTSGERYVLWLFVAGDEPNSHQARENLARLCERCLDAPCEIIIYDVLKDFQPALDNRVLVTPTLIRVSPPPRVTILGNLSDTRKVVAALRRGGGER